MKIERTDWTIFRFYSMWGIAGTIKFHESKYFCVSIMYYYQYVISGKRTMYFSEPIFSNCKKKYLCLVRKNVFFFILEPRKWNLHQSPYKFEELIATDCCWTKKSITQHPFYEWITLFAINRNPSMDRWIDVNKLQSANCARRSLIEVIYRIKMLAVENLTLSRNFKLIHCLNSNENIKSLK